MAAKSAKKDTTRNVRIALCDCGGTLRKQLDFAGLRKELAGLPGVASVKVSSKLCQPHECAKLLSAGLKSSPRMVVAACSREILDAPLTQAAKSAKLNPALLQTVNIREQCAWVHGANKKTTGKAASLIAAAVRRLQASEPVKSIKAPVMQNVAVIGGGVAGMQAAATLAKLGHSVTLIHKSTNLGGIAADMPELYGQLAPNAEKARELVGEKIAQLHADISASKRVNVLCETEAQSVTGEFGNFSLKICKNGDCKAISAGAVILTQGAPSSFPFESVGLGAPAPCTDIRGLADVLRSPDIPDRIAIVLDLLGEQGRAVSAQALSAAEALLRRGAAVTLFCSSVRVSATGMEELYRRARAAGLMVVKSAKKPVISAENGGIVVRHTDEITGAKLADMFDLAVMADMAAGGNTGSIVDGLRLGPGGEQQYDDIWMRTSLTNRKGILAAGGARGNSDLVAAFADGRAAANEAHSMLAGGKIEMLDDAPVVDPEKCVLCLTCMRICPHGAIFIDHEAHAAGVDSVSCQRCGICAAECPARAIQLKRFTDQQMAAEIDSPAKVTVFACENSADQAADAAGMEGLKYGAEVRIVLVPCAGKVDPITVMKTLEQGADKVLVLGCHPESCRYLSGASRAEKRIERFRNTLAQAGFDNSRVVFGGLAPVEPVKFVDYLKG
ncbi:MAG: hydrogenase iron-sulfur subunit [Alphaproteobacteria bacterium]